MDYDRHRGGGHPPTPATPPCVRVRTRRFDWLRQHSSNNDGSPSDLKYALESPTDRALARARYQGPRPLPAVLRASRSRTPSARSAARRRRGVCHCRDALDLWTGGKAESEKLPLLRSRHRTLRLIHLELELLRNESRDALHHPLPRPLAANVDVTVIRITNEAMTPALQLPIEFVEHEVAEQWRKRTSLRSPFHARTDQPVLHYPGIQECPDEF